MFALGTLDVLLDVCTKLVTFVPLVFRSSAVVILFFLGLALNVHGFDAYHIPWRKAVGARAHEGDPHPILGAVKQLLTFVVLCYLAYEVCALNHFASGMAITQVLFWVFLLGMVMVSQQSVYADLRMFLSERAATLFHCREVKFVDVMAADMLTSMSKLLVDMEVVTCKMVAVFTHQEDRCAHLLVGPVLASLPYAIRAFQCFLSWRHSGSTHHLVNLGKYLSAFPVIWTSVIRHHYNLSAAEDRSLQLFWLYAVTINAVYSFLWDVFMDWGLGWERSATYPMLRSELRYGSPLVYYAAVGQDLLLRLCWSLKLSSHLRKHATGEAFTFLFEVLEVFRRLVWNFFRVEWQSIKEGIPNVSTSAEDSSSPASSPLRQEL
eukprot:m.41349 g.41349  ORF g.41349 m.41349 type:complete len:378 (+) comp11451_c0_seq1:253-1386(+)